MASRYEIKFSEEARADFDRLQSQAESSSDALRQLLEVHALLDQIAEGDPAQDSLVPGALTELPQRYRTEGGVRMYFRRQDDTRTATVTSFSEAPSDAPKLTDLKIRDIPHGVETESATEFTNENGTKTRMRSFVRKVDWGDSYTVLNHVAMDGRPPRTMITSGRKGEIEGDWRRDVIEVVELLADGRARRYPPQTVPVWLKNPFYEANSKEDMLARLQTNPIPSARLEEIKRLLENDADSA
ncbi:MAG TPA: hypothetical protein VGQ49_01980 [Bryobacteraceae bacterium]|jgi:hypothetical protein|nr:hypothetical protein [Bryobacteraceae bacterium]